VVAAYVQGVARLHDDITGLADAGQRPRQPLAVPLHQAQQVQVPPLVRARDGPDRVLRIAAEDLAEELTKRPRQILCTGVNRGGWGWRTLKPWSPRSPASFT